MADDKCGHGHCCGGNDKGDKHEHNHNWEEYLKEMSKEELMMKKEKLEKKLAMVNTLLKGKKE